MKARQRVRCSSCDLVRALMLASLVVAVALALWVRESRAQAASATSAPTASAPTTSAPTASAPTASAPSPAAAASTAAPAASSANVTTTVTATVATTPARPPASQAFVRIPPRIICENSSGDPDRCDPLTLERDPVSLPAATLQRDYQRLIRAEGGSPPYRFDLPQGSLPAGLRLTSTGQIAGTPEQVGFSRFRVRVVDSAGDIASQTYSLRVSAPAKPAARPASAASTASAPVAQLSRLDLSQAGPPAHTQPSARVYQLEAAQLDALKERIKAPESAAPSDTVPLPDAPPEPAAVAASAPTPAPPEDLEWSEAQQTQLEALLQPVMRVEYPTRSLFEDAVHAQVCAQAWQLIVHEAQRLKQQPPSRKEFDQICRPPKAPSGSASAPARSPTASAPAVAASAAGEMAQPVSWRDLPAWLMPAGLSQWLVVAAGRDKPLLPIKPLPWSATASCNCAAPRPQQPLFAVYPVWLADGPQAPSIDFSLVNRISYLALPLGDDQVLSPSVWTDTQTAFIRTARTYETRVDFGFHQSDWSFLATEPASEREALIQRLIEQIPQQTRQLLDTRLPGLEARAKAWLPGFGRAQYMGDGVTVFFDQLPDPRGEPELAKRFAEFYPQFIKGLANAMVENRGRQYAINLVMTDRQMKDTHGAFDVGKLFALLKAVEDPQVVDGRIVETSTDYVRNNNIELRFLVLLSEPTGASAKALRLLIGNNGSLNESDRRIFLRSVVPLLLLPQESLQHYRDDLVYVQDNFGGIGFWLAPLAGPQFDAQQAQALRTTFGPDPGTGISEALCSVVCPNRWLFRLAFELLVLAALLCWALLQWQCEWRERYGRYALLLGIPPVIVGAVLVQCDPALEALRKSNASLLALLLIPLVAAAWVLLKRKEDKP